MQTYSSVPSRNLIYAEETMLKHATSVQCLTKHGVIKEHPKRKTDTVTWRRVVPYGATQAANPALGGSNVPVINPNAFLFPEGSVPTPNTISYQDVSCTLQKYSVLFKFSDKAELMYEDDIPGDMSEQAGEVLGEIAERVLHGVVKGGVSVVYANGSTRAGINTPISLPKLQQADRALKSNRGKTVRKMIGPGPDFGTKFVEPSYIVFCHTNCASDVRALPGFTRKEAYGSYESIDDAEIGNVEGFRFLATPLLDPFLAAGAAYAGSGMVSVGGANIDVYPYIVMAADAWGQLKLAGGSMTPTIISASTISHANPTGSFGYAGGYFWDAACRLNDNWMVRIEAAVTEL